LSAPPGANGDVIVAALCWYDEPPELLEQCISSLQGVAAHLVALDGRWDHFDGPSVSPPHQGLLIEALSARLGIPLTMPSSRPYTTQVEKRAALMEWARGTGLPWVLVIDADELITDVDTAALEDALLRTPHDVAMVTGGRRGRTVRPSERPIRRLYRSSTGVTVRHAHNGYVSSDNRFLHGDPCWVRLEEAERETAPLITVMHDVHNRPRWRQTAAGAYYARRKTLKIEQWPRGLKER
jgi:hypothetical protein